jgi:predicted methyltransferase
MLRSVRLFRLFLSEQADPDGFYAALAKDAASQLAEFTSVQGRTVLDIGGGAGYFTQEFRSRGAHC